MVLSQLLKEIGLTETETRIYEALLQLGEAKASEILKHANLNTGKIYDLLDGLHEKGLITQITKSMTKYYSAANPKRILDYLDEKNKRITRQKSDFAKILPDITKQIETKREGTKVEVYMGIEGMKTAFSKEVELYEKNTEALVLGVAHSEKYSKELIDYFKYTIGKNRVLKNIKVRRIMQEQARGDPYIMDNAEQRYLPTTTLVSINIYKDLVIQLLCTETDILTITYESNEIAKSYTEHFNLLWKMANT